MNQIVASSDVNGFRVDLQTKRYDDFIPLMAEMFVGGSPEILAAYWDADQAGHADSVVYFMTRKSDEAIKIGFAKALKNRRRMLEKEHGCTVTVLATRPGGRFLENLYHNRFHDHRLHGEWFSRHPDILAEIDRLNQSLAPDPATGPRAAHDRIGGDHG